MSTLCFLLIYFQGFFGDSLASPTSFPTFAIPTATKGAEKRVKNFKRKVLKRVKAVQVAETILQQLS